MTDSIEVLYVDDQPNLAETVALHLERADDGITVDTETGGSTALDRLDSAPIDCLVSDYDMPGMDGLELLSAVRAADIDVPFILYTGKGSEQIAARAISTGVTDYLQKESGTDHYTVLANRIRRAVESQRAQQDAARTRRFLEKLVAHSSEIIAVVNRDREVEFVSGSVRELHGYEPSEIESRNPFENIHPEDRQYVQEQFAERIENPEKPTNIHFRVMDADDEVMWCRARSYNALDDPDIDGILVYVQPAKAPPEDAD